jgi:hypothetical protein
MATVFCHVGEKRFREMIAPMFRRLILWLLIALLPLQGLRAAEHVDVELAVAFVGDAQHWLDHEHGVAHHHDEDGTVHHDDSQASQDHVSDSIGSQPVGGMFLLLPSLVLPPVAEAPPAAGVVADLPDPFLEKPPRPPHSLG